MTASLLSLTNTTTYIKKNILFLYFKIFKSKFIVKADKFEFQNNSIQWDFNVFCLIKNFIKWTKRDNISMKCFHLFCIEQTSQLLQQYEWCVWLNIFFWLKLLHDNHCQIISEKLNCAQLPHRTLHLDHYMYVWIIL